MMPRIYLYLFRQTAVTSLFICAAATLVVLFSQSFRLLSLVIDNAASMGIFLKLAGLTIPTFLGLLLPVGLAIAIVFVYYKMTVDSELIVMRAAGLTPLNLATPALMLGGIGLVCGLVLTLWGSPWANRELVKLQYEVRNDYSALLLRPAVFNDITRGLTFYARGRDKQGGLEGILIHDNRAPDKPVTVMAERGMMVRQQGEPRIVVYNGKRQEFDRGTGRLSQLDFERYTFDLSLLSKAQDNREPDVREMETWQLLYPPAQSAKYGAMATARFMAEIHQRLATPLFALSLAVASVAIMLGGEFNRRGMAKRILAAAAMIILVQAALLWVTSIVARDIALAPLLYMLALAPLALGLWLLTLNPLTGKRA